MPKALRETKKRIPAGMPRQKLKVEGIDANKRAYWVREDQFQEFKDAGYTFLKNNEDLVIGQDGYINKSAIISRPASRSDDEKLYLMEIDKVIYAENQAIKQDFINDTERQIFNRDDTDTTYSVGGNKRSAENLGA